MLMWALLGLLALVNGVGAFASLPLQPGRLDAMARWSLQAEPAAPAKPEESILYAQDLVEAKEPEIRNSAEAEPERFLEGRALMDDVLDTVVRIYATHSVPSFSMPWQRQRQEQSTSSGFLIEGRRIITNAHSVEYSSMIQVRLRASDHKYVARVLAVGEECDLAVLTVDEDDFWEQTHPPAFGALPELQDDVVVLGYPVGGETLSITRGVVSRVEMTVYTQAGMELLSMQIDAAINPGNSGGPVLNAAGEISGVAFQSLDGEGIENIGYVVPVTVVKHFLEDVHRNGHFSGFPRLGTHLQGLESPALRNSLGMQDGDTGMLVTEVEPISPAAGVLKAGDVLLDVDGLKVACDGTVPFREGERIALRYYFTNRFPGDVINLKCLRNGQVTQCSVELGPVRSLCPAHFDGKAPSYAVIGGLVLTVLSEPFLDSDHDLSDQRGLSHLLNVATFHRKQQEDQQCVLLTQVLAANVNLGYDHMENLHLIRYNGVEVRNLRQLCSLVDSFEGAFSKFEFYPFYVIVLDHAAMMMETASICEENSIPSPRSPDLRSM